jgi:hypothetical protein
LEVTEKNQAKITDLYIQAQTSFKEPITADSNLNDLMKNKALHGNNRAPIDGKAVWNHVNEYKCTIINVYQVIFKERPPSGTTSIKDQLEVCRKKCWFKEQ